MLLLTSSCAPRLTASGVDVPEAELIPAPMPALPDGRGATERALYVEDLHYWASGAYCQIYDLGNVVRVLTDAKRIEAPRWCRPAVE